MKKDLSKRWVKMPVRKSPEWYALMGNLMGNLNYALANLQIIDTELAEFGYHEKKIIKLIFEEARAGEKIAIHRCIARNWKWKAKHMGLGNLLYDLQPYMKPFVKIAKAKIAKEFRFFLLECAEKYNKRESKKKVKIAPFYRDAVTYLPRIPIIVKGDEYGSRYHPLTSVDKYLAKLKRANSYLYSYRFITICVNSEGKSILGVSASNSGHLAYKYNYLHIIHGACYYAHEERFVPASMVESLDNTDEASVNEFINRYEVQPIYKKQTPTSKNQPVILKW